MVTKRVKCQFGTFFAFMWAEITKHFKYNNYEYQTIGRQSSDSSGIS